MSVFKISNNLIDDGYTMIDNVFLSEYLPCSDGNAVKVFTYGLYLCSTNSLDKENTAEAICIALDMTLDELIKYLDYWQEMGLITYTANPLSVNYQSLKGNIRALHKYKPDKFAEFNQLMQDLFPTRMISVNEYNEYYYLIETSKLNPDALYLIAEYCVKMKGPFIRYPYIIAVAKDFIASGILSVEAVEERLKENDLVSEKIKAVFKVLKKQSSPDIDDRQLYIKWTKSWGYDDDSILYAAEMVKNANINKLDSLIDEFFKLGVQTKDDMSKYKKHKEMLYEIAKNVVSKLALYYQSYDYIIELYITNWVRNGFDAKTLDLIARQCFINNIRTLENMNFEVNRLYESGVIDFSSVENYYNEQIKNDDKIKKIINILGSFRLPNKFDRESYRTWIEVWGFSQDVIEKIAEYAKLKSQSFSYLNNILSKCKENKLFTVSEIEKSGIFNNNKDKNDNDKSHNYLEDKGLKDKLDNIFKDIDNFDNIEV